MRYCVNYINDFRHFDKIDEIILSYYKVNDHLIEKVKEYSDNVRIVIDVRTCPEEDITESFDIFAKTKEAHNNSAFLLRYEHHSALEQECKDKGYDFFYDMHINTPDKLLWVIKQGVSDIYLTDELAFSFGSIYIKYGKKINIRLFPNVAQSTYREYKGIDRFFIRPDDISLYDFDCVIIEFFGPLDRQSVLYEIYTGQKWIGALNEVIIGLEGDNVNNMAIYPAFGSIRRNCNKRCALDGCNICERISSFGHQLKDADLGFRKEQENG